MTIIIFISLSSSCSLKNLFIYCFITLFGANIAAVIGTYFPNGLKYSEDEDLLVVKSLPNTPFLLIEMTVLSI